MSQPIIDEIDRVLAAHYGFTDEELDFPSIELRRASRRLGSGQATTTSSTGRAATRKLMTNEPLVVVVVSEALPKSRDWVVTAYVTRRIPEGDVEWKRS